MKKYLSLTLSLIMVLSATVSVLFTSFAETTEISLGEVVEFGSYPQWLVEDELIIEKLNYLADDWHSFGYYYLDEENCVRQEDYMKYTDVVLDNIRYRGVVFSEFRGKYTDVYRFKGDYLTDMTLTPNKYTGEYFYTGEDPKEQLVGGKKPEKNKIYWYEYAPLTWYVLDADKGLLLSQLIVDAQPFNNQTFFGPDPLNPEISRAMYSDEKCTVLSNNYCESYIRRFLNEDFFNTAFSDEEKEQILLTEDLENKSSSDPIFDSPACDDKVFLLTKEDVSNEKYGFTVENVGIYVNDLCTNRLSVGTQYAMINGLYTFLPVDEDVQFGFSPWWLRSKDKYGVLSVQGITFNGSSMQMINYGSDLKNISVKQVCGVRPAMRISQVGNKEKSVDILAAQDKVSAFKTLIQRKTHFITPSTEACSHSNTVLIGKSFDCENGGYTGDTVCLDCHITITEGIDRAPTGEHSFDEGKITKKPTYTATGVRTYTCTACGKTKTETIAKKKAPTVAQVKGLKTTKQTTKSVTLSWSKAKNADKYIIYRSTDGKKWTKIATTTKLTYTDSKLKAGAKYQYKVKGYHSASKTGGKYSAVLKTGTVTGAPAVTLKSAKSKTATATWKKVTGASKYIVYKSTNGKKWTKVTATSKLTYTLTKLSGGKKIYVKVTAVNAYGKASAASKIKSVTVKK